MRLDLPPSRCRATLWDLNDKSKVERAMEESRMGRTERNEVAHAHQSLAARCSRERIGARRSSRCIGRGLEPQGRRRQGGPAAQPHLKDEVSGDDLATMETKNVVLAGDFPPEKANGAAGRCSSMPSGR